jgi:hypothetical protein
VQATFVEQARRGDREAFGVLAGGAVDRLYATARLILRDAELAEDATQDALVRAWRDLPTLRDVERFDAWLYRLLVRSCMDIGRRRRRWRAEMTIVPREPAELDRAGELADRDQLERGLRRSTTPALDPGPDLLLTSRPLRLRTPEIPSGPPSRLHSPSKPWRPCAESIGERHPGGPNGMNRQAISGDALPSTSAPS